MKIQYKINKPAGFVFEYLSDMDKFASIHPVITKIENRGGNTYKVFEKLEMGFIPFSFTYPVIVEKDPTNKRVIMRATVMGINKIEMIYTIAEDNGGSIVDETISFNTVLPIKSIMQNIFRKQHTVFFANLEKLNN